jgi:threonine synthase
MAERYPNMLALFVRFAAPMVEAPSATKMRKLTIPATVQLPLVIRLATTLRHARHVSGRKGGYGKRRVVDDEECEDEAEEEQEEEELFMHPPREEQEAAFDEDY